MKPLQIAAAVTVIVCGGVYLRGVHQEKVQAERKLFSGTCEAEAKLKADRNGSWLHLHDECMAEYGYPVSTKLKW